MWHLPQFSKRYELLIKPSGFGYNSYNQVIYVRIPNEIIPYLTESYYISFVDIEGNVLCFSPKKFSPGTNEVEYYVKIESIDDVNYTSLFVYYDIADDLKENEGKLFEDDFESGSLSTKGWTTSDANRSGISSQTANSGVYSMYTCAGAVSVTSKVINLTFTTVVCYWVRRGSDSFSEDPDSNEDFIVEYLNNEDSWIQLDFFAGNGTPGQIYDKTKVLPVDALHSGFRIRFRQTGGSGGSNAYWHIDDVIIRISYGTVVGVFDSAYIVNYLDTTSLVSEIGPNFSNHSAALYQPVCNTYAVKTTTTTAYVSCSISKSFFTLFFNCYLLFGEGYLVYFSSSNYIYVNSDGSLIAKINDTEHTVGAKLYFDVCSTFSITCNDINTYIVINGLTKLTIKQTFSISEIRLGGNGSSGYSVECYFFDLFLLPSKLPLYSYYLHNTKYDNINFFRESGYDNNIVNGYLTHWPEVIFSGDEVIFKPNSCSGVVYSVSFDDGSHWYVSDLNYDSIFTKYFGSPAEYDTILKLTHSSGIINKDYITKVNDSNQFYVNCAVDFLAGSKKDNYSDIVSDFTLALPIISGTNITPVEYEYAGNLTEFTNSGTNKTPVEFIWGGALGSGTISKPVEFCFDIVMNSWFDDTRIDFWLGKLGQGYYVNMFTDFIVESKIDFYENIGVDFVLSNWKYFPHYMDIICSVEDFNNKDVEVSICSGTLMRFLSDVKVSNMVYSDFSSSVFCSVSGISPYYFSDIQVTSGTLASYGSNIYCSSLDMNNYNFEVKLNTIVIENFNMDVDDFTIGDLCFSVDVYDKYYGVTTSGINVYMNTNTVISNGVTNLQFNTISGSGGYSVSWCYDIGSLGSLEYVEIIVHAVNTVEDINLASYFLKYGKRYYYNLYHILKHDYEKLIPMLMVAENNVDIFPGFSTESMYVIVERYRHRSLGASIFGVDLDKSNLPANINALTTNFYNGGSYKVRIECKDLSGNIMDPFEFEFTIKNDGT